jgi:hypothetical protein
MKYIPITDPRSGAVTKEMLVDLKTYSLLQYSIGAFASPQHWIEMTQVGAPTDGAGAKYWRDNSFIWRQDESFDYLMLDRNPDGSYVRLPAADAKTYSDETFNYYSLHAANFYRLYAAHIGDIPRIVKRTLSRQEAARMNFGPGVPMDYPIGGFDNGLPTFPGRTALRFNPITGQPEAFNFEDYIREFPMDWTPVIKTATRLSDEELVGAVSGVIGSSLPVAKKAAAIRSLSGGK